jgi:iron complex transport system substrate-binding protein
VRIVSLLPSATDIVAALGLTESLVGRTHECDWPSAVQSIPVMTRDELDTSTMPSCEIHEAIESSVHSGSSIYGLDIDALNAAKPDLILTQELCEVCAVSYSSVTEAARLLEGDTKILSLEPRSIQDILDHIQLVAQIAGVPERGERVVGELKERLLTIDSLVDGRPRPPVASLEWLDPLFCAGHWVPEQVERAGGREMLGHSGQHSHTVEWSEVLSARPEVLLLMPCGHELSRARRDLQLINNLPGWEELPAVRKNQVWAVNGPAYFNRPGPRVVKGVEVLAGVLHGVCELRPGEAVRVSG